MFFLIPRFLAVGAAVCFTTAAFAVIWRTAAGTLNRIRWHRIRSGPARKICVFGGGLRRKESLKSNNRIQHTCYSIHIFSKLFIFSFRIMSMRLLAIKV